MGSNHSVSFREPVHGHLESLLAIVHAKTEAEQIAAEQLMSSNLTAWVTAINQASKKVQLGTILQNDLLASVQDEVKFVLGTLHCHCGQGRAGTCEAAIQLRSGLDGVLSGHATLTRALGMMVGNEHTWRDLFSRQLDAVENYCQKIGTPEAVSAKEACVSIADELVAALDHPSHRNRPITRVHGMMVKRHQRKRGKHGSSDEI